MRRACHRVLRYADSGREEARYEVAPIPPGFNNGAATRDPFQGDKIGLHFSDGLLTIQHHEQILLGTEDLLRGDSQGFLESSGRTLSISRSCRKVHFKQVITPCDHKFSALACPKPDVFLR